MPVPAIRGIGSISRWSAATPRIIQRLQNKLHPGCVAAAFAARKPTQVVRYDLPRLAAFNFVLDDALEGGVNASLGLDGHGKSLSFLLLDQPIDIDTPRKA